jgi:hypothetical protein
MYIMLVVKIYVCMYLCACMYVYICMYVYGDGNVNMYVFNHSSVNILYMMIAV